MSILSRSPLSADRRVAYGNDPSQFVDLWLPKARSAKTHFPVVVFLHGGWWSSAFDLAHSSFFCSALRAQQIAVYSIEYRRVGVTGGGWPGTFLDVARALDRFSEVAGEVPLDGSRMLLAGHSAGAHLAFWLAGRQHIVAGSPIGGGLSRIVPRGLLSLAGAIDLQLLLQYARGPFGADQHYVERLMGGRPEDVPDRYLAGDPGHLLPLNVPQRLLQGTEDDQIPPELPEKWAEKARRVGDHVMTAVVQGARHLDLIDPEQSACQASLAAAAAMLAP